MKNKEARKYIREAIRLAELKTTGKYIPTTSIIEVLQMADEAVKKLTISNIVQQRELLKSFLEHIESTIDYLPCEPSELIDDYFKSLLECTT